jgi:quinolinate synthase
MKMHTLKKVYDSLNEEKFVVDVEPSIREKAVIPIRRMLEISG